MSELKTKGRIAGILYMVIFICAGFAEEDQIESVMKT